MRWLVVATLGLTAEQKEFAQLARQFADKEMAPYMLDWDERQEFPVDTLKKAAALGFGERLVVVVVVVVVSLACNQPTNQTQPTK